MRWARVSDRYRYPAAAGGLVVGTGVRWLLWSVVAVTGIAAIALSSTTGHDAADWLVSVVLLWAIAMLVVLSVGAVRRRRGRR